MDMYPSDVSVVMPARSSAEVVRFPIMSVFVADIVKSTGLFQAWLREMCVGSSFSFKTNADVSTGVRAEICPDRCWMSDVFYVMDSSCPCTCIVRSPSAASMSSANAKVRCPSAAEIRPKSRKTIFCASGEYVVANASCCGLYGP